MIILHLGLLGLFSSFDFFLLYNLGYVIPYRIDLGFGHFVALDYILVLLIYYVLVSQVLCYLFNQC